MKKALKCPNFLIAEGKSASEIKPFYDDLIGVAYLKAAVRGNLITSEPVNEALFYSVHQVAEIYWFNIENLVTQLREVELTLELFLMTTSKIASLLEAVNHNLGILRKILTPDEFLEFRNQLGYASGFQSGYRRIELILTKQEFLAVEQSTETKPKCPFQALYWQISSVNKCALEDMNVQHLEKHLEHWRGKDLATLFLSNAIIKNNEKAITNMKRVNNLFGIGFKSVHMALVTDFLGDIVHGTAGSEFNEYLTSSKTINLYPFIYN